MKSKAILMVALFASLSIFFIGLASANLSFGTLTPNSITTTHNSEVSFKFTLTNTATVNITNVLLSLDSVFSSDVGEWTFSSNNFALSATGAAGDSKEVTAKLKVPEYTVSNDYLYKIKAEFGSGPSTVRSGPITVSVEKTPALTLEELNTLTFSTKGKVKIKNTGNTILDNLSLAQEGAFKVTFLPVKLLSLNPGASQEVEVSGVELSKLKFGTRTITLTAVNAEGTDSEVKSNNILQSLNKGFCKAGEVGGNLTIRDVKINNLGDGKDEKWQILDVIEVKVEVKNNGDNEIKDVFLELALFDSSGNDVTNDLDFEGIDKEEADLGNLNDGESETTTYKFKVTSDLNKGDYRLALKAYGDKLGEEVECVQTSSDLSDKFFESIEIERATDKEDFIEIDNVIITPKDVTCGDAVDVSFDVVNVGDENIDNRFRVNLVSSELGLSLTQDIKKDLNEGDTEKATFTFRVPETLKDNTYALKITTEHDYDKRTDTYDVESSKEETVLLKVFGCSFVPLSGDKIASITASLDSDAKAGEEMIVKAVITSLLGESGTFIISTSGFESWASINSISERILDLEAGKSKEITISFNVNKEAKGQQSFLLEARSGNELETREVVVNIQGADSATTPKFNLGDNNLLWLIGIINVILIVLIIVVAVRISRR